MTPKCRDMIAWLIRSQERISILEPKGSGDGVRYAPEEYVWLTAKDAAEDFDCLEVTASSKLSQLHRGGKVERRQLAKGKGSGRGRPAYAYAPSHWGIKWALAKELVRLLNPKSRRRVSRIQIGTVLSVD